MNMSLHNPIRFFSKNYFLLVFYLAMSVITLEAKTDWTILTYVQANNNLYPFSLKNFSDMALIGSNENTTMLVQWFQQKHKGIWRYKVTKGKLELDECKPTENSTGTSAEELVDAMQWAVDKYPANKYSLVLWDHGLGIIDPQWAGYRPASSERLINSAMAANNARIQIPGITIAENVMDAAINEAAETLSNEIIHNAMSQKESLMFANNIATTLDSVISSTRGILFNEHSRTYMDNSTLVNALSTIKTKVLKNKKIDLLGMDACLMAMVEVGYLARDYANILVASQEVELAHGWPYAAVMAALSEKNITPKRVAQSIVTVFETYYKDKIPFYTQSAIDLTCMNSLKTNLDTFALAFKACRTVDKNLMTSYARSARNQTVQFSSPGYVDLHSFFTELAKQIAQQIPTSSALSRTRDIENLRIIIANGIKIVENSVFAYAAGKTLARAKGLSIYFPTGFIDTSYPKNDFSRDCGWYGFIKDFISG